MSQLPSDPLIGRKVDEKYELTELLGRGGMGAVYRAKHLSLGRSIAVKVLKSTPGIDPTFAKRFKREAQSASRLDHPNLVRLVDYGEESDGLLFIAMELLEGSDLFSIVEQAGKLSQTRIVDLLSQVLAGLAVVHEAGIVHRDLKPENIMIVPGKDDDGKTTEVVKLCDFGIAKLMETPPQSDPNLPPLSMGAALTEVGTLVGTPEYLSPEQAQGDIPDARSDLYSVGVMLYLLLTGRLPFEAKNPVVLLMMQIDDAPKPPSQWVPDLDPALEAVCLRALKKERSDRFPSARDMRTALRNTIEGSAHRISLLATAQPLAELSVKPVTVEDQPPAAAAAPTTMPPPARGEEQEAESRPSSSSSPANELPPETTKVERAVPSVWWDNSNVQAMVALGAIVLAAIFTLFLSRK